MTSLIFFCLAAICSACIDTLEFHFDKSVFNYYRCNLNWWNPTYSWYNKYKGRNPQKGLRKWLWFDVPCVDAWHTFKSLMIVFICLSIAFFRMPVPETWYNIMLIFVVFGVFWNLTFNLFYNKILIKK